MSVEIRAVSAERWDDVLAVMGENGAYGGCWCMFWRLDNQEIHTQTPSDNRAALRRLVRSGQPVGLLLYHGGRPVGWCQVAPRSGFRRLFHTRGLDLGNPDEASVWSITCVYVVRGERGNGVAGQLVGAAVGYAAQQGASVIEAYPVADPGTGRKTQLSSGTVGMFSSAASRPSRRPPAAGCSCAACRQTRATATPARHGSYRPRRGVRGFRGSGPSAARRQVRQSALPRAQNQQMARRG